MTTIRVAHRDRFLVLDQETIRNPMLSLRSLGLLVRLLDHPDNWRINADQIARTTREGRDAVRRAIAELEDAGYLVRSKCQVARGRWVTELVLYEHPQLSTGEAVTDAWKPVVGATRDDAEKDLMAPTPGKPTVGKPGANRKTVTTAGRSGKRPPRPAAGCAACDQTGFVTREIEQPVTDRNPRGHPRTEVERCACNR